MKAAKKKEEERRVRGGARETEPLRLDNALKDKELASWDLRKHFKGMATEAKTTAVDTFHTRAAFQRSTARERRQCFLSLGPSSFSSWLQHKARDHGADPSGSVWVLPCSGVRGNDSANGHP